MLKKLISYIFPFTRKIRSKYNGDIELTLINGKKLLDSKNANYSYGSLQKVLKFSLQKVDLSSTRDILILGLGGGSVLNTLRKELQYCGHITAVDIDPVIMDIAKSEFGISSDEKTEIICGDALDTNTFPDKKYDTIIIDLFIDDKIPKFCFSTDFWENILENTNPDGNIIFNTLCDPASDTKPIEDILQQKDINYKIFKKVQGTNNVLITNPN